MNRIFSIFDFEHGVVLFHDSNGHVGPVMVTTAMLQYFRFLESMPGPKKYIQATQWAQNADIWKFRGQSVLNWSECF